MWHVVHITIGHIGTTYDGVGIDEFSAYILDSYIGNNEASLISFFSCMVGEK